LPDIHHRQKKLHKYFIRIGHDNKGVGPGWHLENVTVQIREINKLWIFKCNRWLADNEDDNRIERDLFPDGHEQDNEQDGEFYLVTTNLSCLEKPSLFIAAVEYVVDVYTGDIEFAGTDANVFLTMFGVNGVSNETKLAKSQYHSNKFERNNVSIMMCVVFTHI
jgi:hypothetical protein